MNYLYNEPWFRRAILLSSLVLTFLLTGTQSYSQGTIQVGSGTAETTNFPINSCWGYNYSQQIILASEFASAGGVAGDITTVRYYYTGDGTPVSTWVNDWNVYMGHTSKSAFTSGTDWESISNLNLVYSGAITVVADTWIEISFTTPFNYDGTSNLIIAIDENTFDYSCTAGWRSYTAPGNQGLLYRADGTNPNPNSPPFASTGPTSAVAQLQFVAQLADCVPVTGLLGTPVSLSEILYTWNGSSLSYNYELRTSGAAGSGTDGLVAIGNTEESSVSISSLTPGIQYFFYLQSQCESSTSPWAGPVVTTIIEGDVCELAIDLSTLTSPFIGTTVGATNNFSNECAFGNTSPDLFYYIDVPANASLTIGQTTNGYDSENYLAYGGSCPGSTIIACYDDSDTQTNNWTNLTGETQRVYWVQDGYFDGFNQGSFTLAWTLTLPPSCVTPSALTATTTSLTSATVTWNAPTPDNTVGYEYVISTDNTAPAGNGTFTTETSVIETIVPATTYYAFVRSDCGDGDYSAWVGPVSFISIEGNNCDLAIDLSTLTSPYSGTTVGATNNYSNDCAFGNTSPDLFYFIEVPANATLNIGQTVNGYDSETYVGYGGACPGSTIIACFDDPDIQVINWTNTTGESQTVYWVQDGYNINTQAGTFTLAWTLSLPPECVPPTGLAGSATTLTSATINWNAPVPNDTDGFEYVISTSSTAPEGNGTFTTETTATADIIPGVTHYAFVRSDCGSGSYSDWVGPVSFMSITGDICEEAIDLSTLTSPYVGTTVGATDDYSNECAFDNTSPDVFFFIEVPANATLNIGQTVNAYDSEIYVGYGGDCPGVNTVACFDDPDIQEISWLNTTGETQTVYWVQDGWNTAANAGTYTLAWELILPPPCVPPTGLTAETTSLTTATLSWTAPNPNETEGFQYFVSTSSDIPTEDGIPADGTTADLIDIIPGTTYYAFVRSDCGTEFSPWVGPVSFVSVLGDNCATAIDLGTLTSPYVGTTIGASDNYSIECAFGNTSPDLVYSIEVPADFTLQIGQTVNGYDSEVYIGYGSGCPGSISIDCFDDPDVQNIDWTNTTGTAQTVYWIQDGYFDDFNAGSFTLAWQLIAPPCQAPSGLSAEVFSAVDQQMTLSWEAPVNAPENGYQYVVSLSSATPIGEGTPTDGTSVIVSDISYNTTYYLFVLSDCGDGTSSYSPGYAFMLEAIEGCTDTEACNYNVEASIDDESCTYATTFYMDSDGDGYGDMNQPMDACEQPDGYVSDDTDCDDTDEFIWHAGELFIDVDGDGYTDGLEVVCYGDTAPEGYALESNGADCDDSDNSVWQSANLFVDMDGDGYDAGFVSVCYGQEYPEGYTDVSDGSDCDDSDNTLWQSDNLYIDMDGDGYDNGSETICYGELIPTGYAPNSLGSDCNDNDGTEWDITIAEVTLNLNITQALCSNFSETAELSGGSPAGGSWSGEGVEGSTFFSAGLSDGTYFVTYTIEGDGLCFVGSSATDEIQVEICDGVEEAAANLITIYPSVTTGMINVRSDLKINDITILDMNGRVIANQTVNSTGSEVSLESFASGVYLIRVSGVQSNETFRVIKVD